jgi:uncharacterized membrane protein
MEKEIKEEIKQIKEETGGNVEAKSVISAKGKDTTMAIIAYIVFFIPLLLGAKDDPFVKYHVKQGMVLFVTWMVAWFLGILPIMGGTLGMILSLISFVLMIIGIIGASRGEEKPLPVIGKYADNIKI